MRNGKPVYEPYRIKVLNTINFKKSMKYNPFAYLRSEKDILKLVNTIIANTKGDGEKSTEDFWVKSERLFYCALIGYIHYEAPEDEKNFTTLLEMINASEAREDDPEFQSPVDLMFERLEEKDPEHFAVRQYKKFLLSAGKTRSSILISCGARLAPFDIRELRELMESDEMELDTLGDRKTALFVIISDTDDTFNFVVSILYTQLFNLLCDKADDVYGGRLPVHVRCLLDEFANIGQIPKFEKLIATIRSREISASIILQSQSQLKAIYKDNADTIVGNCDTTLFLGGKEKSTLKEISEILGKETIDSFNTSETRGRELSHGLNYQKLGKDMQQQYEEIKRQCNQERTRLDTEARDREAQISTMAESTSKTIRELTSQKDRLLQEVEQLKSQKDGLETVIELDHERERLEIINDSLRDTERKLREKGDEAVTVLQKKLQQATTNAVDTAFEGRIADQIFQAAAGWNKNNQDEILKRIASQLVDTQRTDVLVGDELVEYLLASVTRYRPTYTRNEILNRPVRKFCVKGDKL